MTKNEDDQKRRRPKTKTTKNEDDQKEDNQKGGYLKMRTEPSLIESYGPTTTLSSFFL